MKSNVKRIISQLVNNLDIPRSGKSIDEDDSWYLTVSNGSYQNVEIRISNHKTDINTWAFRQYRGQSPSTRISIVFRDNDYAGNVLLHEPVKRQISVTEYVYDLTDGSTLSDKEIAMLTKAIRAAANGSFVDPLGMATESDVVGEYVAQNTTTTNNGDTVPSTKWNHGMDSSIEESKTNKNMKKNVIKLNENTLRQIVAESVKKVLKEGKGKFTDLYNDSNTPNPYGYKIEELERRYSDLQAELSSLKKDIEKYTDWNWGAFCDYANDKYGLTQQNMDANWDNFVAGEHNKEIRNNGGWHEGGQDYWG